MRKNYCSIRKNTIRNNHFIQELTPRIPSEIANLLKITLLGLEFIVRLYVLSSSDIPLTSINCCTTHHQPNSFTHSLTNLLYWAYWAHILIYLDLGYDLWPYSNLNYFIFGKIYTTWERRKLLTSSTLLINPQYTHKRLNSCTWMVMLTHISDNKHWRIFLASLNMLSCWATLHATAL